jgi:hypothetical protein
MSFSDDDLKRLKDKVPDLNLGNPLVLERHQVIALLARLEAAERALKIANECRMGAAPIEDFIKAYSKWRKAAGK